LNALSTQDSSDHPLRANPVLWFVWLLLGSTVVAGLSMVVVALRDADRELPASYHWEGERLDRDFALLRNAAAHGVELRLSVGVEGQCAASLRAAPNDPAALSLLFVSHDRSLDQAVRLARQAPGLYRGACQPLPEGRWRISLQDEAGTWAIRARHQGVLDGLVLRARNPEGG
jgi:hypothetical protein